MDAKLEQVHAALARYSAALSRTVPILEAKQDRADKVRAQAQKREAARQQKQRAKEAKNQPATRKQGKVQRNQEKFYQGQEPVKTKSGRSVPIGAPYQPPSARQAPQQPTQPKTLAVRVVEPSPVKPKQAASKPEQPEQPKPRDVARHGALPSPMPSPMPAPMPALSRNWSPGTPPMEPGRQSFLDRVKSAVHQQRNVAGIPATWQADQPPSRARRAFDAFKRVAGLFRRRLLGEERSSTTFKKCPGGGALISTPYKRRSMPKNQFVNPDKTNPTFPVRPDCRASLAGVGRALQKDMSGAKEAVVQQVLQRVNQMGGTRGKVRLRLWGTGVGGRRMDTFDSKGQKAKSLAKKLKISRKAAIKLHGTSTGREDAIKHTAPYSPVGGSKGPSGNREVTRAYNAQAEPHRTESKGKKRRRAAGDAVTIGRGKAKIGR